MDVVLKRDARLLISSRKGIALSFDGWAYYYLSANC